jgi:hypothetical protein
MMKNFWSRLRRLEEWLRTCGSLNRDSCIRKPCDHIRIWVVGDRVTSFESGHLSNKRVHFRCLHAFDVR